MLGPFTIEATKHVSGFRVAGSLGHFIEALKTPEVLQDSIQLCIYTLAVWPVVPANATSASVEGLLVLRLCEAAGCGRSSTDVRT